MTQVALTNATLLINNEIIAYEPNTLVYDLGNPERSVRPQLVGGRSTENVVAEDFETAKSKVTFELVTSSQNEDRVLTWIENFSSNVVKAVSQDNVSRLFEEAVVINKPEFNVSTDGTISVEFESKPAVVA